MYDMDVEHNACGERDINLRILILFQRDSACICYVSTLFPYARYSTVVRLKLAYGEHLANCYNSDITGLVEPGYSFVWLLTRPITDYRNYGFLLRKRNSEVPLWVT